ncbi:unnamed protein product [Clonostachys byssicola]|uniref:Aminoglycoside phosphotransferase domain-containing protein n=1 Tax=Clonostachys byssicola TaxID=160290 RepID=A0A9N9YDI3_9HYPO|nr:unnamed protein product [Clonostachys byssicola]
MENPEVMRATVDHVGDLQLPYLPLPSRDFPMHYREKLEQARRRHRQTKSSAGLDSGLDFEPEGTTILWRIFGRKVTRHRGNIVKKIGTRVLLSEATALQVAEESHLPVPHVYTAKNVSGKNCIIMDFIEGDTLDKLWLKMTRAEKKNMAQQLRQIIDRMRSVQSPPNLIGGCDGMEIRDSRDLATRLAPACTDEDEFNSYLLSVVPKQTPPHVVKAFKNRLKTTHRIVLSHCDLSLSNIIVKDGKVQGLIDWEMAGWYPEYWEYVKFSQGGIGEAEEDWRTYAGDIFSQSYPDELVDYIALSGWPRPSSS